MNEEQAFPSTAYDDARTCGIELRACSAVGLTSRGGMSLRDYFAGQALAGMLASQKCEAFDGAYPGRVAGSAYSYADAMLSERAK